MTGSVSPLRAGARRLSLHLSRYLLLLLSFASAAYCLLSHVPFASLGVVQNDELAWLSYVVTLQPLLFALVAAAVVAATLPRFGLGRTTGWAVVCAVSLGLFFLWLVLTGALSRAGMNDATLLRGAMMFLPLALVGLFDVLDSAKLVIWTSSRGAESARQFTTLVVAGVAISVVFFAVGIAVAPGGTFAAGELLELGVSGFWMQLVVAAGAFTVFAFSRAAASFFYRSAFWEAVFLLVGGGLLVAAFVDVVVLQALAVDGPAAKVFSILAGGSLALLVYGTAIRDRAQFAPHEIESGADLVVAGLGIVPGLSRRALAAILPAFGLAVWLAAVAMAPFDWELVLQQFLVVAAWAGFVGILYRLIPARASSPDGTLLWLEICVLILVGLFLLDRWGGRLSRIAGGGDIHRARVLWRSCDASFRIAGNAMRARHQLPDETIYETLRAETNRAVHVAAKPLAAGFVDKLGAFPESRPNIFVVAIDGLRHVEPAPGSAASLTPEIDLLSREGIEFRNAFSRYGASSMAGPSIWFGGMSLHESYVKPAESANALQKLLDAGRYRQFVAGSGPVRAMVHDGPLVAKLPGVASAAGDCARFEQLRVALEPYAGGGEPVFAYVSASLDDSGYETLKRGVDQGRGQSGVSASVEERSRKVDACVGGFFDFIRSKGIWDSSIVIVTAERGHAASRFGEGQSASALRPEALRVPLVVKLPRDMQSSLRVDPDAIAFNSDLTATFYYLLGQRPTRDSGLLGRPLFTLELAEQLPYLRGDYLVASGHGPVFGILAENGGRLYVADAINAREVVHELSTNGKWISRFPERGERRRMQSLLDEKLKAIDEAYRLGR